MSSMKRLHTFSFQDRSQAAILREILAKEGIDCLIRNDQLSSGLGEIPFIECCPELWIIDDEAMPRARMFLKAWLENAPATDDDWSCPACGERCGAQFGACWACGALRD
ncbi:MAG: DUF2007 domain-containing protein [Desulfuromonas sp.]|nr:MAG: DUF2007 domain-containing protein [Desulfuromonas sp.]